MTLTSQKKLICIVITGLCSLSAFPALASTVGVSETYTLPTGSEINGNAYLAGGTVIISGPITGDAVVAGGNSTFSGVVSRDLLSASGSAEILGTVLGNVRVVGGTITVAHTVGGDASLVAGTASLLSGSSIAGDALLVGGQLSILGDIKGSAYITGGNILIDGKINGNVKIYAAGDIRIGKNAVIGGDVSYRAAHEAMIDPGAVIGGKTTFQYTPPLVSARDFRGFFAGMFGLLFIARLLVLIAAALLFVLVFRRASVALVRESTDHFWKFCLIGLAVLVSVPFAALILALTVFGGLIAAAAVVLWVLMLLIAQVYAGVITAALFQKYVLKRELPPVVSWRLAVLGVLGFNVIGLVPYLGLFLYVLFFLVALGSLSSLGYRHFLLSR